VTFIDVAGMAAMMPDLRTCWYPNARPAGEPASAELDRQSAEGFVSQGTVPRQLGDEPFSLRAVAGAAVEVDRGAKGRDPVGVARRVRDALVVPARRGVRPRDLRLVVGAEPAQPREDGDAVQVAVALEQPAAAELAALASPVVADRVVLPRDGDDAELVAHRAPVAARMDAPAVQQPDELADRSAGPDKVDDRDRALPASQLARRQAERREIPLQCADGVEGRRAFAQRHQREPDAVVPARAVEGAAEVVVQRLRRAAEEQQVAVASGREDGGAAGAQVVRERGIRGRRLGLEERAQLVRARDVPAEGDDGFHDGLPEAPIGAEAGRA
jgi:hypothetical protein